MTLLTEVKQKFAFWADLISQKRTAAETVVHTELVQLGKVLQALEGRVVILTDESAAKLKALVASIERDLTADEAKAKAELEGALGMTADAAKANAAQAAAQQPPAQPAPSVPTPAAVAAVVESTKASEAEVAPAVDVTKSV